MNTVIRVFVDLRDRTLQKSRIAFSNRLGAIERGEDEGDKDTIELLERWFNRFDDLEKELDKDIAKLVGDIPIVQHAVEVKGIGPMLIAKAISMIDIERAQTVSALWRYAGYGVVDGKAERRKKGEELHYNMRLKTTCYLIGSSFLKSNSPYRIKVYDPARAFYDAKGEDWPKGRCHNAAMRKMVKMWLSHLWVRWRELEGLPITNPYVHEKLGHNHQYKPEEFGWPVLSQGS